MRLEGRGWKLINNACFSSRYSVPTYLWLPRVSGSHASHLPSSSPRMPSLGGGGGGGGVGSGGHRVHCAHLVTQCTLGNISPGIG